MSTIRGHQAQVKLYRDNQVLDIIDLTSFDFDQDSDFTRSMYIGNPVTEGDQSEKGWTGTAEAEVRDSNIDAFIDALITSNLAGIGVSDHSLTYTENYPDGQVKSWMFYDLQWKLSGTVRGLDQKVTKRLSWQAAGRVPL